MTALLSGIFLGWSLGYHDAANVFGSAVSSRMLKFSTAALLASAFALIGAVLEGKAGIETLAGLTHLDLRLAAVCSLGAAITVTIMTTIGLPVSTSQAAVGAIIGIAFFNRQLNVAGMGKVIACWLGTPVGAAFIAVLVYRGLGALYNRLGVNLFQSDVLLRLCLITAGSYGAYALGANNVANVTAVFVGAGFLSSLSAALIGGLSIGLGCLTFSRRVAATVTRKLVRLDAFSALVVVLAEAITMHAYTFVGVPVSASQAVVGAVLGVGIVKGINTVRRRTLVNILLGWFLTPAVACFLALVINFVVHLYYVVAR
jgi:PiT family inorganic phosphate transporter